MTLFIKSDPRRSALAQKPKRKLKKFELVDPRLVRSLTHPMRVYILTILNERTASARELSEELDESFNLVSYHVKELRDLGVIEVAETRKVRSVTEHLYRATARQFFDADTWAQVPMKERNKVTATILAVISKDLNEAIQHGTFDSSDESHLSRTPMVLDSVGETEVVDLLANSLNELLEIQERSSARLTGSDETGERVKVAIMHFKSPQPRRG